MLTALYDARRRLVVDMQYSQLLSMLAGCSCWCGARALYAPHICVRLWTTGRATCCCSASFRLHLLTVLHMLWHYCCSRLPPAPTQLQLCSLWKTYTLGVCINPLAG